MCKIILYVVLIAAIGRAQSLEDAMVKTFSRNASKDSGFITLCCQQGQQFDINLMKCVSNEEGEPKGKHGNTSNQSSTGDFNKLEQTTTTIAEEIKTIGVETGKKITVFNPITNTKEDNYKTFYYNPKNTTICSEHNLLALKSPKHVFTNGSVVLEDEAVPYQCLEANRGSGMLMVLVCATKHDKTPFHLLVFTVFECLHFFVKKITFLKIS